MTANLHRLIVIFTLSAAIFGCTSKPPETEAPAESAPPQQTAAQRISYSIIKRLPHDPSAFTQGLELYKGSFLESTGQNGFSTIRRVDVESGRVLKRTSLDDRFFGEGITQMGGKVYMLTWLNGQGLVFDANTLKQTGSFTYSGEGWGITNDGTHLYMSNGTSVITVIDPQSWRVVRTIPVSLDGMGVSQLNELEWINGEIWANVWQSDKIVRIAPTTGNVRGVMDLTGLLPQQDRTPTTDVLNGIAWDSASKTMYVTGKNWPAVFALTVQ